MKTVALTCATPIIKKKKKNSKFHLRMSLIKLYKISALEYMFFYMFFTCLMKWDVFIKNFCKLKLDGHCEESSYAIGLCTELVAFLWNISYLKSGFSNLSIWWTFF